MKHQFGLVLSGGGVRGAAHIGILRAFELAGISPSVISGSSSGALIGALYASGMAPEEIYYAVKKAPLFSIRHYALGRPGLLNSSAYINYFKPYFERDDFDCLQKSLYICATDLIRVKSVYFNKGKLLDKIVASCAYPFIFSPVEIENSMYADGGIMNNFPLEPIENLCNYTIGVYTNPLKKVTKEELSSSFKIMERSFMINVIKTAIPKFSKCDFMIIPEGLEKFNIFNKKNLDDCYKIGYQYGLEYAEKIEQAVLKYY